MKVDEGGRRCEGFKACRLDERGWEDECCKEK